jgi:hypothetical protein
MLLRSQITNCYSPSNVERWFETPNSCMIISFDYFASLTAPVVFKAKRRRLAAQAAVEAATQQENGGPSAGDGPPHLAVAMLCRFCFVALMGDSARFTLQSMTQICSASKAVYVGPSTSHSRSLCEIAMEQECDRILDVYGTGGEENGSQAGGNALQPPALQAFGKDRKRKRVLSPEVRTDPHCCLCILLALPHNIFVCLACVAI